MADWHRQRDQHQDWETRRQDWRARLQTGRDEGGPQRSEWRPESEGSYGGGSQSYASQAGYGADRSQQYGQGPQDYGSQNYGSSGYGDRPYGGEPSTYGGYRSQSGSGGWQQGGGYGERQMGQSDLRSQSGYGGMGSGERFGSQASQREFRGPQQSGYGGQQSGYSSYGSQGSGQQSGYGGYASPTPYGAGSGGQSGFGQSGIGPSGERAAYSGYGSSTGFGTGADAGYTGRARIQRRGPKGYKRSDERIKEDLCERLMLTDVDASDVTVDVRDGNVILQGTVPERRMKHRIEDIADECSGVNDIENNLRVVRQESDKGWFGRSRTDEESDALNRCLRGELSAIETYRQALDRDRKEYGSHGEFQRLSEILREHEDAASRLRQLVRNAGGEPSQDSGAWGTWSKVVMGAAKLFGNKSALKSLKEGEESGLADYQRFQREFGGSTEAFRVTSQLMTRQQQHIRELDRLIDAAD